MTGLTKGLRLAAAVASALWLACAPASAQQADTAFKDAWAQWSTSFVDEEGRVVDTGNKSISHSEGQGYGMVFAVSAGDRAAFDRLWLWTQRELLLRDDGLAVWSWHPKATPRVPDVNNATDGDLLIAWALLEAAERWRDPTYRKHGMALAASISRHAVLAEGPKRYLRPGVVGFGTADRPDGPVVNLSYWVFPALTALHRADPGGGWDAVSASGLALLRDIARTGTGLPSEWTSLKDPAAPRPATGFEPVFGYNAIRVPLYLAWSGLRTEPVLARFLALNGGAEIRIADVTTGKADLTFDRRYSSVLALVRCAVEGTRVPAQALRPVPGDYYASTVQLLSLLAIVRVYPSCL